MLSGAQYLRAQPALSPIFGSGSSSAAINWGTAAAALGPTLNASSYKRSMAVRRTSRSDDPAVPISSAMRAGSSASSGGGAL